MNSGRSKNYFENEGRRLSGAVAKKYYWGEGQNI